MARSKRCRDEEAFKPSSKKHQASTSSARSTTRLTTKHSVFNAVLLTTELLEPILSQLPMKDLLLAQRVSRKWRDVIAQSKEMQQQLFMLPREAEFVWDRSFTEDGDWSELTRFRGDKSRRQPGDYEHTFNSGDVNELLLTVDNHQNIWSKTSDGSATEYVKFGPSLPPLDNPEASWRRMLLTQPPIFDVWMDYGSKSGAGKNWGGKHPNGATMNDIVKPFEDGAATGEEWDPDWHYMTLSGIVVLSEEDRGMEFIHEGEWNERHSWNE
ncbi:hypothetical protein LTR17_021415 [Elasticomyces elasticus]|nr:hypothetical protein LTR17_021415 [Elasticomyces elasticus]